MIGLWKFHCDDGKERGIIVLYTLHSLKNKPKSGYEILKEIEEKTKGKWIPSKGTLYPLLKRLEQEDLIKISSVHERSKTVFELTDKGKRTLSRIRKHGEESRKKFILFKDLFIDVFGKEPEIEDFILKIRDVTYKKFHRNKEKTLAVLKNCISELENVD